MALHHLIAIIIAAADPDAANNIDVNCVGDAVVDTSLFANATRMSVVGSKISIHGTCLVSETIMLLAGRAYTGDSRTGTVLIQANGSNLIAVVASEGYAQNHSWTDNPTSIAHLTVVSLVVVPCLTSNLPNGLFLP
jgi:hypothetical protein